MVFLLDSAVWQPYSEAMTTTTPLTSPLTQDEMTSRLDENGYITGLVLVDLSELIDNEFEETLDMLSERLTGSIRGMDINYNVVAVQDDGFSLIMKVSLDPSMILDDLTEDQEGE